MIGLILVLILAEILQHFSVKQNTGFFPAMCVNVCEFTHFGRLSTCPLITMLKNQYCTLNLTEYLSLHLSKLYGVSPLTY